MRHLTHHTKNPASVNGNREHQQLCSLMVLHARNRNARRQDAHMSTLRSGPVAASAGEARTGSCKQGRTQDRIRYPWSYQRKIRRTLRGSRTPRLSGFLDSGMGRSRRAPLCARQRVACTGHHAGRKGYSSYIRTREDSHQVRYVWHHT